jgi:hypothetical protein
MGDVVLDPGVAKNSSLRIYAQCSKDGKGGVTLVALNTDTKQEQALMLPLPAEEFTLTAPELTSTKVMLNGSELRAEPDGSVGSFKANAAGKGPVRLPPSSLTFLTFPTARNKSCK